MLPQIINIPDAWQMTSHNAQVLSQLPAPPSVSLIEAVTGAAHAHSPSPLPPSSGICATLTCQITDWTEMSRRITIREAVEETNRLYRGMLKRLASL